MNARPAHNLVVRRAVSALELIVAVMIIGIVGSIAVPRYVHSLSVHRSRAAAKRIVADVELAKREATMSSAARTIRFVTSNESYELIGVGDLNRANNTYQVDLGDAPYNSQIVSVNLGGDAEIVFDGYGQVDSAGTIVVRSGTVDNTIVIDAATGEAKIQ